MRINQPFNKLKHFAIAVSLVFGLAACSSDDDPPANVPPVVSSVAVTSAVEGVLYTYTFTATDDDVDDQLILASVSLPQSGWLTFDATSGELSGTPEASDVGNNTVSLTVSDGTDTVTQDFTIVVTAAPIVNTAPAFTSTGIAMGTVGTLYTYTATATDAEEATLSFALVTPLADLAPDAEFDTVTGVLTFTPNAVGDYPVEITVTDGVIADPVSQTFTIVVSEAPEVVLIVFENAELPGWTFFGDAAAGFELVTDEDPAYDQVVQFSISSTQPNTVAGFDSRDSGTPFDASAFASTGTFSFDMKVVTDTPEADTPWILKLESVGEANTGDYALSSSNEGLTPVTGVWQTYTFDLADLATAGLDLEAIDVILMFPAYGLGAGAVYQVDNVKISSSGATGGGDTGGGGTGGGGAGGGDPGPAAGVDNTDDFGDVLNGGFEDGTLGSWQFGAGADVSVVSPETGSNFVKLVAIPSENVNIYQSRIGEGVYTPGQALIVSFEMKGTGTDGSVASAELYTDDPTIVSKTEILGPLVMDGTWNTYSFDVTAGNPIGWGVSLRLGIVCGAVSSCEGEIYFDNIKIIPGGSGGGGTGGGGAGGGGPVVVPGGSGSGGVDNTADFGDVLNGGFEDGTLDSWQVGAGADVSVVSPETGSSFVKIVATPGENVNIYQSRIGEGVYTPGQALTVSFDMKGTGADGAVASALLYTDDPTIVSKTDELNQLILDGDWYTYTFNVTTGNPIGWGVSLRLGIVCGVVATCTGEIDFDNIKITPTN